MKEVKVGMFMSLYLASKKSSEREFFVPARMHLGVKLLRQRVKAKKEKSCIGSN